MTERRQQDTPVAIERRRGRRPLAEDDPSCNICLRMEGSLYDRVFILAAARRMSVPEYIRLILRTTSVE